MSKKKTFDIFYFDIKGLVISSDPLYIKTTIPDVFIFENLLYSIVVTLQK